MNWSFIWFRFRNKNVVKEICNEISELRGEKGKIPLIGQGTWTYLENKGEALEE